MASFSWYSRSSRQTVAAATSLDLTLAPPRWTAAPGR